MKWYKVTPLAPSNSRERDLSDCGYNEIILKKKSGKQTSKTVVMVVLYCVPSFGVGRTSQQWFSSPWDALGSSPCLLLLPGAFQGARREGKELPDTPAADEQQPPKRWLHDFVYRELVKHFGKLQDEKDYINVRYYYY